MACPTLLVFLLSPPVLFGARPVAQVAPGPPPGPLAERVGDTGFVQLSSPSFEQVVEPVKGLDLPKYRAGINPEIAAQFDRAGKITTANLIYPRDAVRQYPCYASLYGTGIAAAATQSSR